MTKKKGKKQTLYMTRAVYNTMIAEIINSGAYQEGGPRELRASLAEMLQSVLDIGFSYSHAGAVFGEAEIKWLKGHGLFLGPREDGKLTVKDHQGYQIPLGIKAAIEDLRRCMYTTLIDITIRQDYLLMRTSWGGAQLLAPRLRCIEHPLLFDAGELGSNLVLIFPPRESALVPLREDLLLIYRGEIKEAQQYSTDRKK